MDDIEFIKKCCEYAESVSIDNDTGLYLFGNPVCICDFQSNPLFKKILLQEAIEGVNKKYLKNNYVYIDQQSDCTNYRYGHEEKEVQIFLNEIDSPDKAKRSALKYIFEQEKS